ncbi:hypothetical protein MNBD_ALPHA06-750 [hydrothermal vent metagenome]|uniref:Head-tail adaptor protein n=1 Tax=hydrothermal vent metagenome TaxID=652676 RepID=A0A3B0SFT0_9ZZZZ
MNRLGDMSEQVVLQSQVSVPDGAGGQLKNWSDFAIVWAEVRPASATKGTRIAGTTVRRFIKIFVRDRPDLTLPLQVLWDNKTLRVLALRRAAGARTELECEEVLQ